MTSSKIKLYYNTLIHLKFSQFYYRIYYAFRTKFFKPNYTKKPTETPELLTWNQGVFNAKSYQQDQTFTFLNISHQFKTVIDWNFSTYGKLWTYNLNYFDFLHQQEISKEEGLRLIHDFIDQQDKIKDGLEPYPISLRGINWIKFLSQYKIEDQKIDDTLYTHYYILMGNLEYHLLGNHLLENGFSLLFGAYYFQDSKLYTKAKKILTKELDEQILDDGAHFELSPMYHQLMLFRVLDCINLVKNNSYKNQELLLFLEKKAEVMLGWLNTMTFKNGDIPLFNDSTNNIAPTTEQLNSYALALGLNQQSLTINHQLSDSGYRKMVHEKYELIMDVGNIGPDYIPGHAHADTFNFELYVDNKPFIVDTGLSTYEKNKLRQLERSTVSHNTVTLNNEDQSQVWDGFRVADRAYITQLEENLKSIKAMHNGYKRRMNAFHEREFVFERNSIRIIDKIDSDRDHEAMARLHFHPDISEDMIKDLIITQDSKPSSTASALEIKNYNYAPKFNKRLEAKMIEIPFFKKLEVEIAL